MTIFEVGKALDILPADVLDTIWDNGYKDTTDLEDQMPPAAYALFDKTETEAAQMLLVYKEQVMAKSNRAEVESTKVEVNHNKTPGRCIHKHAILCYLEGPCQFKAFSNANPGDNCNYGG